MNRERIERLGPGHASVAWHAYNTTNGGYFPDPNEFLDELVELEFMVRNPDRLKPYYRLTELGREWLDTSVDLITCDDSVPEPGTFRVWWVNGSCACCGKRTRITMGLRICKLCKKKRVERMKKEEHAEKSCRTCQNA